MKRSLFSFLFFSVWLLSAVAVGEDTGRFYVIVNSANPISSMEEKEISKLFLKKIIKWPNGQPVLPVDQPESSPALERFSKEIHNKTPEAVKSYWRQQIFSGRNIPPLEKGSDSEVVVYVKANPNAIGYVSTRPSEANVKVLKVIH